jgi:uncharacterized protein YgfB (UPF0149 family)
MSQNNLPKYEELALILQNSSLSVSPAELHGILVGLLSGGLTAEGDSWQPLLFDYLSDGNGWPMAALSQAQSVFEFSGKELSATDLKLSLLLPEEDEDLSSRADALSEWISLFISGLGLSGLQGSRLSVESKEALADLEEMSKLGIDEDDDMQEQAMLLEQVIEHVKVCVLTIHTELGSKPAKESKPTIH